MSYYVLMVPWLVGYFTGLLIADQKPNGWTIGLICFVTVAAMVFASFKIKCEIKP